jgi:hypothetical protein
MAPAEPVPYDSSSSALSSGATIPEGPGGAVTASAASRAAVQDTPRPPAPVLAPAPQDGEPVTQEELNAWRRGFTPQAEIWNGRLAMLGLSVGLGVLLLARLVAGAG